MCFTVLSLCMLCVLHFNDDSTLSVWLLEQCIFWYLLKCLKYSIPVINHTLNDQMYWYIFLKCWSSYFVVSSAWFILENQLNFATKYGSSLFRADSHVFQSKLSLLQFREVTDITEEFWSTHVFNVSCVRCTIVLNVFIVHENCFC